MRVAGGETARAGVLGEPRLRDTGAGLLAAVQMREQAQRATAAVSHRRSLCQKPFG